MKGMILWPLCILIAGCASANLPPVGKAYEEWVLDETYCRISSGKRTGLSSLTPQGIAINAGGASAKYDQCLKERGW